MDHATKLLFDFLAVWQRRRGARHTGTLLRELDDATLRDLGLCRSEIDSLAGESAGLAQLTRVRAARSVC